MCFTTICCKEIYNEVVFSITYTQSVQLLHILKTLPAKAQRTHGLTPYLSLYFPLLCFQPICLWEGLSDWYVYLYTWIDEWIRTLINQKVEEGDPGSPDGHHLQLEGWICQAGLKPCRLDYVWSEVTIHHVDWLQENIWRVTAVKLNIRKQQQNNDNIDN